MSKKVTKQVTKEEEKEEIPEETSSESEEPTESLNTKEFDEKYLDLDELLLHLVTLHKFKRNTEEWVRETSQLLEDKVEMKEYNPESSLIRKYLADFTDLSYHLMKVVSKVRELTKRNK